MSYNIDTWKTKHLHGLRVPIKRLYENERKDWHPERPQLQEDGSALIEGGAEIFEMVGQITKDIMAVSKIACYGEGSGIFLVNVLIPALQHSKGQLEAVLIWEGGDSITRLRARDGKVEQEGVDL